MSCTYKYFKRVSQFFYQSEKCNWSAEIAFIQNFPWLLCNAIAGCQFMCKAKLILRFSPVQYVVQAFNLLLNGLFAHRVVF